MTEEEVSEDWLKKIVKRKERRAQRALNRKLPYDIELDWWRDGKCYNGSDSMLADGTPIDSTKIPDRLGKPVADDMEEWVRAAKKEIERQMQ